MIQLRSLISELHGLKALRVFDFDDTLVKTESNIYVIHADGTKETLTPAEYAVYDQRPDDKIDYSDFHKMLRKPNPINKNIKLLMRFMKDPNSKVTILTARALAFPIRYYLKKQYSIDVYTVALGDANPQKKADWIEDHIKKGYDDIFFMDDSPKNIHAVDKLKERYPNVKLQTVHIKDNVSEENLNEFQAQGFDLDEFLKMNSFAAQIKYANEKLKRIAQGSARIIFEIDDKTVLKLAKNAKGLAQNEVERSLSNDYMVPEDIIAKVLEEDEKDRWIVMERAKKIGKARFRQLVDGVNIEDFYHYIETQTKGKSPYGHFNVSQEVSDILDENEFTQDLIEMVQNFDIETGDFQRPSSFGEIDGRLVITDYGLTQEVYKKYYDRSRKPNNQWQGDRW